jgi:hypothetical protein
MDQAELWQAMVAGGAVARLGLPATATRGAVEALRVRGSGRSPADGGDRFTSGAAYRMARGVIR